jgi:radical SAM-linked protein
VNKEMRLCLQYSKEEEARFLSHLDLMRAMERALRRAQLPLVFSEGFNPHLCVSYASALAVGVTSEGEYLDLPLKGDWPAEEVVQRVNSVLPAGLKVVAAVPVTQRRESLMAIINLARYRVEIPLRQAIEQKDVEEMTAQVLARPAYSVLRRGKKGERQVDIRPGLWQLQGWAENNKLILHIAVQTGSQGNVKPEEVIEMVKDTVSFSRGENFWGENIRIHRLGLYIRENDKIYSPLERA